MRPLTDEIIETVLSLATTMRIIRDLLKEATETLDEAKGKDMRKCQGIIYEGINDCLQIVRKRLKRFLLSKLQ